MRCMSLTGEVCGGAKVKARVLCLAHVVCCTTTNQQQRAVLGSFWRTAVCDRRADPQSRGDTLELVQHRSVLQHRSVAPASA
jgi:hypothetical protein